MPYFIIFAFIITGITFFMIFNSGQSSQAKSAVSIPTSVSPVCEPSTSRSDIMKRLKELAKSPAPKNLQMGAMCYEMASPPERVEYVCPVCGSKTLYPNPGNSEILYFIGLELVACRQKAKKITKVKIVLDESQFCRKCKPDVKLPQLCLTIHYPDQTKHSVCKISEEDLDLISEFFAGSDKHKLDNDAEIPLKDYIKRLEELLGIKIK